MHSSFGFYYGRSCHCNILCCGVAPAAGAFFLFSTDTSHWYHLDFCVFTFVARPRSHYRRICFSKSKHEDFLWFQLCCQVATTQITDTPRVCSIATALQHVTTTVKYSVIITLWYEIPVITLTYFSKCCWRWYVSFFQLLPKPSSLLLLPVWKRVSILVTCAVLSF